MISTHPEEMAGIVAAHCGSPTGRHMPRFAALGT